MEATLHPKYGRVQYDLSIGLSRPTLSTKYDDGDGTSNNEDPQTERRNSQTIGKAHREEMANK